MRFYIKKNYSSLKNFGYENRIMVKSAVISISHNKPKTLRLCNNPSYDQFDSPTAFQRSMHGS